MEQVVYIWVRTNGYAPNQCGSTITLGELIEQLQELSPMDTDIPVFFRDSSGYGGTSHYGSVDLDDFEVGMVDLEDDEDEEY